MNNKDFLTDDEMLALEQKELAKSAPDFISDEEMGLMEREDIDRPALSRRQIAKGASLNLSDEFAGGLEVAGRVVGLKGLGGKIKDIETTSPELDVENLKKAYYDAKNAELSEIQKDIVQKPEESIAYDLVGGAVSPVSKIGKGLSLVKQAAIAGGLSGYGASEGGTALEDFWAATIGAATGGAIGKAASKLGSASSKAAEELAENATGATAVQASKFKDGAGRELLDKGIVSFLDSPENIAAKSDAAIKQAERTIDSALKALDKKGVVVSADKIAASLEEKIAKWSQDPSMAPVVRKLRSIVDDIYDTGRSNVKISEAEITKRGYNTIAKNWLDPDQGRAGKVAYLAYRDAVEEAAQVVDPKIAQSFIGAKKVYALMSPIREAAERRALQLNQSPIGGLLDVAAATTGTVAGGPAAGVGAGAITAAGRRALAPRAASTAAVSLDLVSKMLSESSALSQIAAKNPTAIQYIIEKITSFGALPTPYEFEQGIIKDLNLKPSEKALLRKENSSR